jgi:tight adherence protein C
MIIIGLLFGISIYMLLYQLGLSASEKAHLPSEALASSSDINLINEVYIEPARSKKWFSLSNKYKGYEQSIRAGNLRRKLIKAGLPLGLLEFLLFKALSLIFVPVLSFIFLSNLAVPKNTLLILSLAVGFLLPEIWLNTRIKKRQRQIRRDLPNIIDLLTLCVGAGLDFMLAVNRVVKDLKPCQLTQELAEVYRQTQMGKSRREALKSFAWRIDMPEVYSFVRTLVQADRMGTPMAEALKLQSEEMRTLRFHRGEAMALKAPIKLLFPLFAFILPVVLIIVAGPIILQFMGEGINFKF